MKNTRLHKLRRRFIYSVITRPRRESNFWKFWLPRQCEAELMEGFES